MNTLIPVESPEVTSTSERRHNLDALRAFAMLLGIGIHASLSFIPGIGAIWGVQDSQSHPVFGILMAAIHGWRMPLFFLISGFFTAMLWRKRGFKDLIIHRFKRIFLPLLLSMATIVPLLWFVVFYVRSHPAALPTVAQSHEHTPQSVGRSQADSTMAGTRSTDVPTGLGRNVDVFTAVATYDTASVKAYLEDRGNVNAREPNGSTLMHVACLLGHVEAAQLLLESNVSLDIKNNDQALAEHLLALDWNSTALIAQLFQLSIDRDTVLSGRKQIAGLIEQKTGRKVATSGRALSGWEVLVALLFYFPLFHHLWFLWFLCWFVCGFAVFAKCVRLLKVPALPKGAVTSLARYAWLIPLVAVPQYLMTSTQFTYGPDTSVGLIPRPVVFTYYAIFFGYGVLYYLAHDNWAAVGKEFWWSLPIAVCILFPLGLALQGSVTVSGRVLSAVLQVAYAWAMSFAMIGLFYRVCSGQRAWIRYLSDSSYWLYLAHLPLVLYLQFLVRDIALPAPAKFVAVCFMTIFLLLITYQVGVRYTWIGTLLNGKRLAAK